MNEQIEENGVVEEKKEFKPSWPKALGWLALFLSLVIPIASVGVSIMCISSAKEEERDEVRLLCYIALGVSAILLLNDLILRMVLA